MKIAIVGAGILGKLLAFNLVNLNHTITLFDESSRFNENHCSAVAAGLLTPSSELEKAQPLIFELGLQAINHHWPDIIQRLNQAIYFQKKGSLFLSHPRDSNELARIIQQINSQSEHLCRKLSKHELWELEPDLSKFNEGYYLSEEGQIDNQTLLQSLTHHLQHKIEWRDNTHVDDLESQRISIGNKMTIFDLVLDCRGLGAKNVFHDLRSIRGELIWLHAPEVNLHRPVRLAHPRYHLYIAPRPNNHYILGSSEIESADQSPISVRTTLELLTATFYIHSGFAEARIIKMHTQCRPTLSSHLPKIKYSQGLIAANGLYRHGFLIAPTLVNDICQYITKGFSSIQYPDIWEKIA